MDGWMDGWMDELELNEKIKELQKKNFKPAVSKQIRKLVQVRYLRQVPLEVKSLKSTVKQIGFEIKQLQKIESKLKYKVKLCESQFSKGLGLSISDVLSNSIVMLEKNYKNFYASEKNLNDSYNDVAVKLGIKTKGKITSVKKLSSEVLSEVLYELSKIIGNSKTILEWISEHDLFWLFDIPKTTSSEATHKRITRYTDKLKKK